MDTNDKAQAEQNLSDGMNGVWVERNSAEADDRTQVKRSSTACEEWFRVALSNSDIAFWTFDFETHEICQNAPMREDSGRSLPISDAPRSLVESGSVREDSAPAFLEMCQTLEDGAKTASGEFWVRRKDAAGWCCNRIDCTTVFDDDGKPLRAHAVSRDVTDLYDRQQQQQSILQSALIAAEQASRAKTDFLSRMSHEIRTPMNAIIGMSAAAARAIGDDAQVADCIGKIGIS